MIEKIEITQRFNFKRLNRHYECFTIDFLSNTGYYKISERGSGDKFLLESPLCDDSWIDILVDLRSRMTSEIRTFDLKKADRFIRDFDKLNLFEGFESEKFLLFEKLEVIYSCTVIIYSSEGYFDYSFKNSFPEKWEDFGRMLEELVGFDVLHLNYQRQFATPLYHQIERNGVYLNGEKLSIKTIEFGHYRTYPYDSPYPRLIVNFEDMKIDGYVERELTPSDEELILDLLERYHVYRWICADYHRKSKARDPDDLEGYDWYLEIVFKGDVIWHLFGYNEYPDTYVHFGREIIEISGMDLAEIGTICDEDIELFNKFGDEILSQ